MAKTARRRKRATSMAADRPAPTRPAINPKAVKDWSKRIVAVRGELQQFSTGDVQVNQARASLLAALDAIQGEMDRALERAE